MVHFLKYKCHERKFIKHFSWSRVLSTFFICTYVVVYKKLAFFQKQFFVIICCCLSLSQCLVVLSDILYCLNRDLMLSIFDILLLNNSRQRFSSGIMYVFFFISTFFVNLAFPAKKCFYSIYKPHQEPIYAKYVVILFIIHLYGYWIIDLRLRRLRFHVKS